MAQGHSRKAGSAGGEAEPQESSETRPRSPSQEAEELELKLLTTFQDSLTPDCKRAKQKPRKEGAELYTL